MTHNYFDFEILPTMLNDIINESAEEMINNENRIEHKRHFNNTLDIIKSLTKTYDVDYQNHGYLVYALNLPFDEECEIFSDNTFIFTFPVETNMDKCLMLNEDYDFPYEEIETDSDIDMDEV